MTRLKIVKSAVAKIYLIKIVNRLRPVWNILFWNFIPTKLTAKILALFPSLTLNKELPAAQFLDNMTLYLNPIYLKERDILLSRHDQIPFAVIDQLVKKDTACLDIGASIGTSSLALARKTGPGGRVYSCEPSPEIFTRLKKNIEANPFTREIIRLFKMDLAGGIPMTIDQFLESQNAGSLDFLEINAQGMEYETIVGGLKSIKKYRPILFYTSFKEWERCRGRRVNLLIENLLKDTGYSFYKTNRDGCLQETSYPDLSDYTLAMGNTKVP